MDLLKEYKRLYEHWVDEFQKEELTELSQNLLLDYKKFYEFIENFELTDKKELKKEIIEIYKRNISFLFKDLLKMREVKIINSALSLQELNLDSLNEAEKLLFQNLVASIKGFKKVKSLSIYEDKKKLKFPEIKPMIKEGDKTKSKPSLKEQKFKEEIKEPKEDIELSEREKIEYELIRFLKDAPALVGADLLNYGPFKKEDIANIPKKNAQILVNEKFAEIINVN